MGRDRSSGIGQPGAAILGRTNEPKVVDHAKSENLCWVGDCCGTRAKGILVNPASSLWSLRLKNAVALLTIKHHPMTNLAVTADLS